MLRPLQRSAPRPSSPMKPPHAPISYLLQPPRPQPASEMEAVFFRLHVKFVAAITRLLPRPVRKGLEYVTLMGGIGLGVYLAYLHVRFVSPRGQFGSKDACMRGALRASGIDPSKVHVLQIFLESSQQRNGVFPKGHLEEHAARDCCTDPGSGRESTDSFSQGSTLSLEAVDAQGQGRGDGGLIGQWARSLVTGVIEALSEKKQGAGGGASNGIKEWQGVDGLLDAQFAEEKPREDALSCKGCEGVYLFSLERGFLTLRQELREQHGVVMANIAVDIDSAECGLGLPGILLGYDTVIMNGLISLYGGRGFLFSMHNKALFNLNYAAEFVGTTGDLGVLVTFKVGVAFTALFLFFTTTTLVSFTLRETQERMLKFTFLLQHHIRHRLPYAPLVLTHVVESLVFVPIMVGILFFLVEFFGDQLLAFMVLSVVWMCEVYSVVSVRTDIAIRFFPRMFFLYFTLFHLYFFSFPFGFGYLALVVAMLLLQHSMLFFWNRYEVPALLQGQVSASQPRMSGIIATRTFIPLDVTAQQIHPSLHHRHMSGAAGQSSISSSAMRVDSTSPLVGSFPFSFYSMGAGEGRQWEEEATLRQYTHTFDNCSSDDSDSESSDDEVEEEGMRPLGGRRAFQSTALHHDTATSEVSPGFEGSMFRHRSVRRRFDT